MLLLEWLPNHAPALSIELGMTFFESAYLDRLFGPLIEVKLIWVPFLGPEIFASDIFGSR